MASRRRDILFDGRDALLPLPTAAELAATPEAARRQILDGLRGELYAVASVVADRSVERAWSQRGSFPPYGLAQSLFSQLHVVRMDPEPYPPGAIDGFDRLGRALLDTVVYHLERELASLQSSELGWVPARLEELLALFRASAGRAAQARMRDAFSFMYGGLHFGSSLCVQMAEVMARMLATEGLGPEETARVMGRSVRALYQVAAINLEDIPWAYGYLTGGSASPWLSAGCFRIGAGEGGAGRIELVLPPPVADGTWRYSTLGCPARTSPNGRRGPIATLWGWCVDLVSVTGLAGVIDD